MTNENLIISTNGEDTLSIEVSKSISEALIPCSNFVWKFEQIEDYLLPALNERLKNTPKENIITPDLAVGGHTIEALRFVGHKPDIRELYANLLASSMDSEKAYKAHPAFVEIIKQITSDEAKLLKHFSSNNVLPIVNIDCTSNTAPSSANTVRNYSHLGRIAGCQFLDLMPNYLDNLARLALISINTDSFYTNNDFYKDLENDSFVLKYINNEIESPEGFKFTLAKGSLTVTALGKQFIKICV